MVERPAGSSEGGGLKVFSDALVSQEEEPGLWEHWCRAPMGRANG